MIQVYKVKEDGTFDYADTTLSEPGNIPEGYAEDTTTDHVKADGTRPTDAELLEQARQAKIDELDQACSEAILSGFDYTIDVVSYHFSLSLAAQANFQGTDTLFKDGVITTTKWTVVNNETGQVERIDVDQTLFNDLKMVVSQTISQNVSRFRDTLEPQVKSATTLDEIDAIVW